MSCSSGLNSITAAKSSAVLQRSSHSSLWRRLFWRQLPLTFCANRLEPSASILRSALPPKADINLNASAPNAMPDHQPNRRAIHQHCGLRREKPSCGFIRNVYDFGKRIVATT